MNCVDMVVVTGEFAPRVHKSGHWTKECTETRKFKNHLRAIMDLPLGSTAAIGKAAMVNFIGGLPKVAKILAIPDAHAHWYDKDPRKVRKLAHAAVRSSNA